MPGFGPALIAGGTSLLSGILNKPKNVRSVDQQRIERAQAGDLERRPTPPPTRRERCPTPASPR